MSDADSCVFLFCLPRAIDEQALNQICSSCGEVQSCLIAPNDCTATTNVGFVQMANASQARDTVQALNGATTETGVLSVRAGPSVTSRQAPCDNLYVRSMPANWTEQDLHDLFSNHGTVQECRILHRGDDIRGAGALVRMSSVASATQAILALNGHVPSSGLKDFTSLPLLVRFADSPEEKARKQARKEQMSQQPRPMDFNLAGARMNGRSLDIPSPSLDRYTAEQQLRHAPLPSSYQPADSRALEFGAGLPTGLDLNSQLDNILAENDSKYSLETLLTSLAITSSQGVNSTVSSTVGMSNLGSLGSLIYPAKPIGAPVVPAPAPLMPACTSLYVKNLPPAADRLWMYERFAPHGAILSVKVLQEEGTNRCRGVGFVNFVEAQGALKAINNVNGVKVADKHLHVSLQAYRGCF